MKTKIKRHSRSVISVLLAVCMLVSCMTVGLIATDAAKVTDGNAVATKVDDNSTVGAKADTEMVGAGTLTSFPAGMKIYFKLNASKWNNPSTVYAFFYTTTGWSNTAGTYTSVSSTKNHDGYFEATVPNDGKTYLRVQFRSSNNVSSGNFTKVHEPDYIWNNTIYDDNSDNWTDFTSLGAYDTTESNTDGKLYFDNSKTNWTGNIYAVVSRTTGKWYFRADPMTAVTNAPGIYYIDYPTTFSDGYTSISFVNGTASSNSDGDTFFSNVNNKTTFISDFAINNDSSTYVGEPVTSGSNVGYTLTYQSGNYDYFDKTYTLYSGAGGSAKIDGYQFTAHGSATKNTQATASASGSTTMTIAKSSTVTVTPTPVSGYRIKSVTLDSKTGTALTDAGNGTYTYKADGSAHSIYVEYEVSTFSVSAEAKVRRFDPTEGTWKTTVENASASIGTVSADPTSVAPNGTITLSQTIVDSANYTFEGWFTDAACTTPTTATPTVTANTTYYGLFKEKAPSTVNVTLVQTDGGTITVASGATGSGNSWTAYEGATVTFSATPAEGKKVEKWSVNNAQTDKKGNSFTINNISADSNVQARFVDKGACKVNVVINDDEFGSAEVVYDANNTDRTFDEGENVTFTVTPAGDSVLENLLVETVTAVPVSYITGATSNGTTTYTFEMPDDDVEIRVYFKYYTAMANWWLDGYNDDFSLKDNHNTLRMTEGMYNGQKFAYWYTKSYDDVKIFTIKNAADANGGGSATGKYFYVEVKNDADWTNDVDYKFSTDSDWHSASYVRSYTTYGTEKKLWKAQVPAGATSVQFRSHSVNSTTTEVISGSKFTSGAVYISGTYGSNLTANTFTPTDNNGNAYSDIYSGSSGSGSSSGKVFWYGDKSDTFNHVASGADPGWGSNVKLFEYKQDNKPYYGHVDSGEFNKLSGSGVYVIVYYPQTNYGEVNGVSVDLSSQTKPTVVVSTVFPGGHPTPVPVTIYAKDGTLRDTYQVLSEHATTEIMKIVGPDGTVIFDKTVTPTVTAEGYSNPESIREGNGSSYYQKMPNIPKGSKVTVKTTLSNTKSALGDNASSTVKSFCETHYVRGYVCNGVTYELHDYDSSGVYTETITIPSADPSYTTFEITPVYYLKDTSNCKTFIIQGYDEKVQKTGWGNTLAAYPYYNGVTRLKNAFGGYPGQPLLFYGGTYMIQIPTTNTGEAGGAEIRGLTLSNFYWDTVHRAVDTTLNDHRQTYDYDDFYKIYKEKAPDNIYLRYKYRNVKDNYDDGYGYAANINRGSATANLSDYSANGNGIEPYLDALDRQIDIFGTVLTNSQITAAENSNTRVLIVSDGYVSTFAGDYATEWTIYKTTDGGTSYTKIGSSIAPSMLLMNNTTSWNKYSDFENTAAGKLGYYKSIYQTLESLRNIPADITFEREIRNYTAEQANRLDAQWLYSKNTDLITARTKIEYLPTGATEYVEDPYTTNSNVGSTTGTKAYFTNVSPKNIKGLTVASDMVINPEVNFTMLAEEATDWEFVGWYMQVGNAQGGITETKVNKDGFLNAASPMVANATYVARFKQTKSSSMQASHVIEQTNTYTGNGTPYIKYTIFDANGTIVETNDDYQDSSAWNFKNSSYIKEKYKNYIIKLELKTVADAESEFTEFSYSTDYEGTSFALQSVTKSADNKTATAYAQFTVANVLADMSKFSNLQYVSHLTKIKTSSYQYVINYNYTSRFWGAQTFQVSGSLTDEDEITAYTTGSEDDARLTVDFLTIKTPTEKNFQEILTWPYSSATQTVTHSTSGTHTTYTITVNITASQKVNDLIQANFALPYEATAGVAKQYNGYTLHNSSGSIETISTQFGHMFERGKERGTEFDSNDYDTDEELQAAWDAIKDNLTLVEAPSSIYRLKTQYAEGTPNTGFNFDGMYHAENHNGIQHGGLDVHALTYETYYNFYKETFGDDFTDYELQQYAYEEYLVDYAEEYAHQYWKYYETDNKIYTFNHNATSTRTYTSLDPDTHQASSSTVSVHIIEITGVQDISKFDELKFNRWRVESTAKAGSDSQIIMYGYNTKFNLSGYENYTITPEYVAPGETPVEQSTTGASATISYLENSRNQWNVANGANDYNVYGEGYKNKTMVKADKLFADFNLAFNYNNTLLKHNPNVEVGMIIEQLGTLAGFDRTNMYTCKPDTNYKNYIDAASEAADETGLVNLVKGTDKSAEINGRNAVKVQINTHELDSKNRIQFYYTFNNKKVVFADNTGAAHSVTADFSKAYRAYTYVKVGNEVTLCENPAYFTLYDMAISGYRE